LTVDDFNRGITDFTEPPQITISETLRQSENEDHEKTDDKRIISGHLTSRKII